MKLKWVDHSYETSSGGIAPYFSADCGRFHFQLWLHDEGKWWLHWYCERWAGIKDKKYTRKHDGQRAAERFMIRCARAVRVWKGKKK